MQLMEPFQQPDYFHGVERAVAAQGVAQALPLGGGYGGAAEHEALEGKARGGAFDDFEGVERGGGMGWVGSG
jgi:hypothetical protein